MTSAVSGPNLWIKRIQRLLVSLLSAVFVWLSIINQQDPMIIRSVTNIPVPCPELAGTLLACDDIADTLQAQVRAPQSVWERLPTPYYQHLTVTLLAEEPQTGFTADMPFFPCRVISRVAGLQVLAFHNASDEADIPCGVGIPRLVVPPPVDISPDDEDVEEHILVPITIERVGEVPDGFILENLVLNHQYVETWGTEEQLALIAKALAYIPLYSSAFSTQNNRFEMPVPVQLVDREGNVLTDLGMEPATLVAILQYSPLPNTRRIRVVPDTQLAIPSGYRLVQIRSVPEYVTLQGPAEFLDVMPDPLLVSIREDIQTITRTTTLTAPLSVPSDIATNVQEVTFTWEVDHVILDNTQRAGAVCAEEEPDLVYDFAAIYLHLRGPYEAFDQLYAMEAAGDFQWQVLYDCPTEEGGFTLRAQEFVYQHESVEASQLITMISHDPPEMQLQVRRKTSQDTGN